MIRLAFFASHNGSAARAISAACRRGTLAAEPVLLVSNNPGSGAVAWAREDGLRTAIINNANSSDPDSAIAALLEDHGIDLALCSGYMKLIGPKTIAAAHGAILNVHPALLPRHGGHGMYGTRVHQAVHDAGDPETGITIHLVDADYDRGRILSQKTLPVGAGSSASDIEAMVKAAEPDFYVETLRAIMSGEIPLSVDGSGEIEQ